MELGWEVTGLSLQGSDPLESGFQERTPSRALGAAVNRGSNRLAHKSQPYEKSDRSQED